MTRFRLAALAAALATAATGTALAQSSARIFLHPNGCVYTAAGSSWHNVINGGDYFVGARRSGCPVTVAPVPGAPSLG
jgi:ABC-type sugar transport system substrate-binding protein